jgi:hypothetical protein
MRAVNGSSARVPRVPKFEANDRLKFTPEEQQAIQAADRGFGYRSQSDMVDEPRPSHGLAIAIALALAYFLFLTLTAAVLHSFSPQESPRESEAPMAETIQSEIQPQTIPDSSALIFLNQVGTNNQPAEAMSQRTSDPDSHNPASALGQITPADPSTGLSMKVIGEEQ